MSADAAAECPKVRGTIEYSTDTPPTHTLELSAVAQGDKIGVDASRHDLGLPEGDIGEHRRIVGEVERVRGVDAASDIWLRTPSGAELHIYPKRGKVERVDDGERVEHDFGEVHGVATLRNAGLTFEGEVNPAAGLELEKGDEPYEVVRVTGSIDGVPVQIDPPMTPDEIHRDARRARRLIHELRDTQSNRGNEITYCQLYGSLGRIGVTVEVGHRPLRNGIRTGHVDGFDLQSVTPRGTSEAYLKFTDADVDQPGGA